MAQDNKKPKRASSADLLKRFSTGSLAARTPRPDAPTGQGSGLAAGPAPDINPFSEEAASASGTLQRLKLDLIDRDPAQPRKTFDMPGLTALSEQIRAGGVLQPPVVRPHPQVPGRYMIIFGERRTRAMRMLDWSEGDFLLVTDWSEERIRAAQLIENSEHARENVHPLEEAEALKKLCELLGSQQLAAAAIGHSKAFVSKRLDLLELPEEIRECLAAGRLGDYETAVNLGRLRDADQPRYEEFVERVKSGAPVKRAEVSAALKGTKPSTRKGGSTISPELRQKVADLRAEFSTKLAALTDSRASLEAFEMTDRQVRGHHPVKITIVCGSWTAAEALVGKIKAD